MKATYHNRFGPPDVLEIRDMATPAPKAGEILIRQHATVVTTTDSFFRSGKPFLARAAAGLIRPSNTTLGDVVAGEIVAVGADVTEWQIGDRVFGTTSPSSGAHAEYVVLPKDGALAKLPPSIGYAEAAAATDGALTALTFLRKAGVTAGQYVLVNGASGGVGGAGVQLATHFGAHVTGVASGRNEALVRSLGATGFVDYTAADYTQARGAYDLIFDAVGKSSFRRARRALKRSGIYLRTVPSLGLMLGILRSRIFGGKRAAFAAAGLRSAAEKRKDLALLAGLMEAGTFRAVIDRTYPFAHIAEAHAFVDAARKQGEIVISFDDAAEHAIAA